MWMNADRVLMAWFGLMLLLALPMLVWVLGAGLGAWLDSPAHQWAVVAGLGVTLVAGAWQRWGRPRR